MKDPLKVQDRLKEFKYNRVQKNYWYGFRFYIATKFLESTILQGCKVQHWEYSQQYRNNSVWYQMDTRLIRGSLCKLY